MSGRATPSSPTYGEPVVRLLKPEKPRPWAISCSTTLRKLIEPAGCLPSRPKYHFEPSRQPVEPSAPLKRALMSALPGLASWPASASVSAEWYQVLANAPAGAGALNENTLVVPA